MFKVADYLIQSQAGRLPAEAARLLPLDTRGATTPVVSLWVLLTAVAKITRGRLHGGLAGLFLWPITRCIAQADPVGLFPAASCHRYWAGRKGIRYRNSERAGRPGVHDHQWRA
jgi:hypothetical protein